MSTKIELMGKELRLESDILSQTLEISEIQQAYNREDLSSFSFEVRYRLPLLLEKRRLNKSILQRVKTQLIFAK